MVRFSKVLFIIFSSLAFAILAMFLSRYFIPKNVGLAGGAMVLFYGLIGWVIGLIVSFLLRNRLSGAIILGCNIVFALLVAWVGMRFYHEMQKSKATVQQERERLQQLKPTAPAQTIPVTATGSMGIGLAKPQLQPDQPLYFYPAPKANQLPEQLLPSDSITFKPTAQGIEIATAPPWLVPEKLKLDYQIFYFRVKSQNRYFLEVVGNKTNGQTAWIAKSQADYQDWPSFLLTVHALQPQDWENNPLRTKPLRHAPPLLEFNQDHILQPLKIKDYWIEVNILDQQYQVLRTGWIRWRSESELLITYDLLS